VPSIQLWGKEKKQGDSGLRKYQTWAYLSAEGKTVWGDVFADGKIPIQSIIAQPASLEGITSRERVFLVDWKELTNQQQDAILGKISKRTGASKNVILKEVLKVCLCGRSTRKAAAQAEWGCSFRRACVRAKFQQGRCG
jgi:hypothetical protein